MILKFALTFYVASAFARVTRLLASDASDPPLLDMEDTRDVAPHMVQVRVHVSAMDVVCGCRVRCGTGDRYGVVCVQTPNK